MKLSQDFQEVADLHISTECDKIANNYLSRLTQFKRTATDPGTRCTNLPCIYEEYLQVIGNNIEMAYQSVYDQSGLPTDDEDLAEIGKVIKSYLKKEFGQSRIMSANEFETMNLDTLMESIIKLRLDRLKLASKRRMLALKMGAKVSEFAFMADPKLRSIVERDYSELERLDPKVMPKSVLVLAGSILEGIFLDAIVFSGYWTYQEASERFLRDMIHPVVQRGIIQHDNLGNVVRVFRNLVHPAREIRDNLAFDKTHAEQASAALKVIIGEVRNWYKTAKSSNRTPTP